MGIYIWHFNHSHITTTLNSRVIFFIMDIQQVVNNLKNLPAFLIQQFETFKKLDPVNKEEDRLEFFKFLGIICFVMFWIRFLMLRSKEEKPVKEEKKDKKKD